MNKPFLPPRIYYFLFAILGLVYFIGLFVPLMDNDAAHHANIALRMYLKGDYINLVDQGADYLDKPHLHFWLCALSYKIFGVTSFAYKFPSLLFSIGGVYSTYRLGKALYDHDTGKLAALIIASAFGFMLANADVRMDAILTACIAFASWHLISFIQHKYLLNAAGAALGLALGFCTKGHIAVFVPAIAALFYILWRRDYRFLLNWKWLVILLLFALFISPVVYFYYLQFNLHPEKLVRGKDQINGVRFILFEQLIDRFTGKMEKTTNNDHFFFLHSFLPAFAPWSLLAWIAVVSRLKSFFSRKEEWATTGIFMTILLVVSFSGYQLPHYLNVVFPFAAVMVSSFIINKQLSKKWVKVIFMIETITVLLILSVAGLINAWAFPVQSILEIVGVILFFALVFYFIKSKTFSSIQKAVTIPVATMIFFFFLLNSNFYPQLLKYQGGNELAFTTRGKIDQENVYCWPGTYSSSYSFYTMTFRKQFTDSVPRPGKKIWLLFDIKNEEEIKQRGYRFGEKFIALDYEITKLDIKFVNPEKRDDQCTKMLLVEISN